MKRVRVKKALHETHLEHVHYTKETSVIHRMKWMLNLKLRCWEAICEKEDMIFWAPLELHEGIYQ